MTPVFDMKVSKETGKRRMKPWFGTSAAREKDDTDFGTQASKQTHRGPIESPIEELNLTRKEACKQASNCPPHELYTRDRAILAQRPSDCDATNVGNYVTPKMPECSRLCLPPEGLTVPHLPHLA